jgi:hypothetical protein
MGFFGDGERTNSVCHSISPGEVHTKDGHVETPSALGSCAQTTRG